MTAMTDFLPKTRPLAAAIACTVATLGIAATNVGCEDDEVDLDSSAPTLTHVLLQEGDRNAATSDGDIELRKTAPSEIKLGESTEYTIEFANATGGPINGLTITEELPQGFQFDSASPEPSRQEGNKLYWDMGSMREGDSGQITINGTAQELGDLQACTGYEFDRGVCSTLTVVNPELRIEKALRGEGPFSVCSPVELVYTVTNEGDSPAEDVMIFDELPQGLMFADEGDNTFEDNVGALQPGDSIERTVMVKASQPTTSGSYAMARSELSEVKSKIVEAEFVEPQLSINATATNPYTYVGQDARFDVMVTNDGEVAANRVVMGLAAGQGAQVIGVYGTEQNDQGQVQIDEQDRIFVGTLQPGQSRNVTIEVDTPDREGNVEFAAVTQAVCEDSGTELARAQSQAQVEVRTISALQLEVVDKNDPVQVGDQTVYEITVINEGTGEDENVRVSATLPEGSSFVSAEGETELEQEGQTVSFAPVDVLNSGDSATWYVTIEADEGTGSQKFNVTLQSDLLDSEVTEAEPTRLFGGN